MQEHDSSGTENKPLLVIVGRSNVGKSSVVRLLTRRRVRVGKRPGTTRWASVIDLGSVVLVDMPGFGHAEGVSRAAIEEAKTRAIRDLEEWGNRIVVAVLILDVFLFEELVNRWERREEIPIDIEFYGFLSEISQHMIIVANKMDRVRKTERTEALDYIKTKMIDAVPDRLPRILAVSASKRTGIRELRDEIDTLVCSAGFARPSW